MKYITKEVRIGIAGIIALCVLVYGINWLKGIHMFQPSSYFYAKFENVNGLTKSSPVFADGVRVGIVRDIYYDYAKPGNVVVQVELDTELRIPKGSSAELVSELMGGVRMNILLANNPREKYAVGDTIPGKLNNGMMESVAQLMPKGRRNASETGFYPHLSKQYIRRQEHPCHPALDREDNRQPGSSQFTGKRADE